MSEAPPPPSFPTPTAAPPAVSAAAMVDELPDRIGPPAGARALNLAAFAALAAALGLVAVGAMPAVLQAAGLAAPPAAAVPFVARRQATPKAGPGFVFGHEDPAARDAIDRMNRTLNELSRKDLTSIPDPMHNGVDERAAKRAEMNSVKAGSASLRFGTAKRTLLLLEEPGDITHETGLVHAQEQLMVVKEVDDWVLVYKSPTPAAPEPTMGWARKSEIAIR